MGNQQCFRDNRSRKDSADELYSEHGLEKLQAELEQEKAESQVYPEKYLNVLDHPHVAVTGTAGGQTKTGEAS